MLFHKQQLPRFLVLTPSLLGVLSSFGAAVPLFGRIAGLPSVTFSAAFMVMVMILCVRAPTQKTLTPPLIVAATFLIYAALVALSTFAEQWEYFFSIASWLNHSDDYVASKLVMIVVTSAPAIFFGAVVALFGSRETLDGMLLGFILIAVAAAIRTFIDAYPLLAATDYETARLYFIKPDPQFSTVSYGILFVVGAACCLSHRYLWPLAAIFLFLTAWLDRKTDTVLITLTAVAFAAYSILFGYKEIVSEIRKLATILLIAAAIFVPLHNEANIDTWKYLSTNIQERVDILNNARSGDLATSPVIARILARSHSKLGNLDAGSDVITGLGSFAINSSNPGIRYPHNILVETYIEIGVTAAISVAVIFLFSSIYATVTLLRTRDIRILSLLCANGAVFLIALKSGDATSMGRITLFALLCSASMMLARVAHQHSSSTAS